jgi:hypothetical protein
MTTQSGITKTALVNRLHEKQMFDTEFKAFIRDQSISLEERWDFFKFACENNLFVNVDCWLYNSKLLERNNNFTWYDYFYIEKYQTVYFPQVIQDLSDKLESALDPENDYDDIEDCLLKSQEEIDELKEEILATGYSGFVYDW